MTAAQVTPIFGSSLAASLRRELSGRAQQYAQLISAPYCLSYGESPSVCFEPYAEGKKHGNFLDSSYRAILRNPLWAKRLAKVHTHSRKSLPGDRAELDSCNSSDALLMNIFWSGKNKVYSLNPDLVPILSGIEKHLMKYAPALDHCQVLDDESKPIVLFAKPATGISQRRRSRSSK